MSDNIFANAGQWTPVKVTDTTNILDTLAKAYDKQKESFKGLVTLHDDFWKTAQKQHQQDAVNALNNMSVDELTAVDANGLTAKQNYMNQLEQAGKQLGGYTNMTEMGTLFDTRLDSAIADENAKRVRDEAVKQDEIAKVSAQLNPLITMSNNSNQVFSTADQQRATKELEALAASIDPNTNPYVYNHVVKTLNDNGLSRINDNAAYLNAQNTHAKADYEANHASMLNPHLHSIAKATALLGVASSVGDTELVKKLQGQLDVLQASETMSNGKDDKKDGALGSYFKNMSEGAYKHFTAIRDAETKRLTEEYAKEFRANSQLDLAMQKQKLAEASFALEKYIAENGSWYQQQQAAIANDRVTLEAQKLLNQQNNGGDGSGSGGKKSDASTHLSYSKNSALDKEYADLGMPFATTTNANGETIINAEGIKQAFNEYIRTTSEKDYDKMKEEISYSAYANGSDLTGIDSRYSDLVYHFNKKDYDSLNMSDYEKTFLIYKLIKTEGKGNGSWNIVPSDGWIKHNLQKHRDDRDKEITNGIQQRINLLSRDYKDVKIGALINEMGLIDAGLSRYLTKEQVAAATTAKKAGEVTFTGAPKGAAAPTLGNTYTRGEANKIVYDALYGKNGRPSYPHNIPK